MDYDTNFKVNPPLRTAADIEALKEAIKDGIVDCLATDHAPHLQSEKELEFLTAPCGIASLECALSLYVKALVEPGVIGWSELIGLMTYKPAGIIGVDKGTLSIGAQADVTIFDPDSEHIIDADKFYSKSRNCPYDGWKVNTKVMKTIVAGEIRYSEEDQCQ
jgi:dihydroorotase